MILTMKRWVKKQRRIRKSKLCKISLSGRKMDPESLDIKRFEKRIKNENLVYFVDVERNCELEDLERFTVRVL